MAAGLAANGTWSETWTFLDGDWHQGNVPMMGPRTHAAWLGSSVFDGGRVFDGVMPDLDRHFARLNRSAETMALTPSMSVELMLELAQAGIKRFAADTALYVKPMYWGEMDGPSTIMADPDSTRFCLCLFAAPLPEPRGMSLTLSPYRRPSPETMPTDAKAGCLYPNNARALREAKARGFDNCLVRDLIGNIAETSTANIFMVKDGVVMTPAPNSTFLNGITRQRIIALLRGDGIEVREMTLTFADFLAADEIFSSGNYAKVAPVTKIEDRVLQPGPIMRRARELYWAFAHDKAARTA